MYVRVVIPFVEYEFRVLRKRKWNKSIETKHIGSCVILINYNRKAYVAWNNVSTYDLLYFIYDFFISKFISQVPLIFSCI